MMFSFHQVIALRFTVLISCTHFSKFIFVLKVPLNTHRPNETNPFDMYRPFCELYLNRCMIVNNICDVQPFSKYSPRTNDISFWLPETGYSSKDFYDLVRSIGGDTVLKVILNDVYTTTTSPPRTSHCYTITYQLPDGPITQAHVAAVHSHIEKAAIELLGVKVRWMLPKSLPVLSTV